MVMWMANWFLLCRVLFRFLDMKAEAVRVYSLKIIGCFLQYCPAK